MTKTILVTNDDGVRAEGLAALARALAPLGEVLVVAPSKEASAVGHALTLHHPLRLEQVAESTYAVDGTPTDCVNIAFGVLIKGRPDLVVSGINSGWNLGDDVTYSGTVAGAMEGALLGVPSIAVSLQRGRQAMDYATAAEAAAIIAGRVLEAGLPTRSFLNINVPRTAARGFKVTVQARRNHVTAVAVRIDPKHRPYYWIDEAQDEWDSDIRSDYQAVRDGFISVTPLQADLTDYGSLGEIRRLMRRSRLVARPQTGKNASPSRAVAANGPRKRLGKR